MGTLVDVAIATRAIAQLILEFKKAGVEITVENIDAETAKLEAEIKPDNEAIGIE